MASKGKRKTTMAKLDRERRVQERRVTKAARKDERKLLASRPPDDVPDEVGEAPVGDEG